MINKFGLVIKQLEKKYPTTRGRTIEFVKGNFSLFITLFEDGRGYAEIFRCTPQQEKNKCSSKELSEVVKAFNSMDL